MAYLAIFLCVVELALLIGPCIAFRDARWELNSLVSCVKNLLGVLRLIRAGVRVEWALKDALREHNPVAEKSGDDTPTGEAADVPETLPTEFAHD